MAATDGVGKAFALDLVPEGRKATALGILGTFTGIATLGASTIAGVLWEYVSPSATFLYGVVGSVVAMVIFASIPKQRRAHASVA